MGNNKLKRGMIPQRVFQFRDALVRDFFNFYECNLDEIEIIQLGDWEPNFPPTVEQMGTMLGFCITAWTRYIDRYQLPQTLKPTLENILKREWQARENTAQAIPKHQRTRR